MNVTREEAAQALTDISMANERIVQLKGYQHGSPFFIIWGLVWFAANGGSYLMPDLQKLIWPISLAIGFIASLLVGILQSRKWPREAGTPHVERNIGSRMGMTAGVVMAFVVCIVLIAQPQSNREINAMISIVFPFLYMAGGIWAGWRLFAIGLITAVAIMGGYFWMQEYFSLWMAIFGGGSLIAGGLWLRTA